MGLRRRTPMKGGWGVPWTICPYGGPVNPTFPFMWVPHKPALLPKPPRLHSLSRRYHHTGPGVHSVLGLHSCWDAVMGKSRAVCVLVLLWPRVETGRESSTLPDVMGSLGPSGCGFTEQVTLQGCRVPCRGCGSSGNAGGMVVSLAEGSSKPGPLVLTSIHFSPPDISF